MVSLVLQPTFRQLY
ncbi:hypothetical protein BLA29_006112 [Euroglyphus maynei]|uniref:Uncharacterized protein n=1 Tax=Euroglyphus maynei TaxID=6958 RepID=A0A1Y3AZL4_EURMA|nr:hypothetical protein BLA29_006112 [Euroglyphus maynei]